MAEEILYDQLGTTEQDPIPKPKLSEQQKVKLDSIVQKMISNKESDANIKMVVEDFKQLYSGRQPEPQQQPAQEKFKPASDWLNIPQQGYQPIDQANVVPIDDHTRNTAHSSNRVNEHLLNIDESVGNLIYSHKKDLSGRIKSEELGLNPMEAAPINQQAAALESKMRQDIPVHPEEIEEYKKGMSTSSVMLRRALAQKAKDLNRVDEAQAKILKGDIYRLDRQENPEKEENISQNIKKINDGEYDYDVENGRLIKPLGFFGSVVNAFKEKGKAYDDYDVYQTGDEKKIMDRIKQRLNDDPDKALPTPIDETGEIGAMLGGTPLKPLVAGGIAGYFSGGMASAAAAAAVSAPEMYKLTFGSALPHNYAALRKQNPNVPDSEILQEAINLTDKQANVDALSGAAMGAIGAKVPLKPATSALLQKSVKSALRQIGETVAIEGLGGGAIGAGGQWVKNIMAQKAGIPVDESEGMAQQLVGGAFMTLGMALVGKAGNLLKPSTKNNLFHALSKLPEETISNELTRAQEVGALTPEEAQRVQTDIAEQKKIDASIKSDVPESDRIKVQELIKKRNELEGSLETEDKAYHADTKEKIKALNDQINSVSKGAERGELQSLVDKADKNNELFGFAAKELKDQDEKTLKTSFKDISEQAHDPATEKLTIDTFGESIVNKAKELYPKEEPKQSSISVIQPGEIKQPETITIKPKENESLRQRSPEAAIVDETSGSRPQMESGIPESGEAPNAQEGGTPQAEGANTGQEKVGEPPLPPTEGKGIHVERPDTQLSFRGLQETANEFGFEDVKSRDRVSDIQEMKNAEITINEWAEKGEYQKNVDDLLNKIESKEHVPTAKQRLILEQYLANEKQKLRSLPKDGPEYNQQLLKLKRIKDVGQIARQEAGAALRLPDGGSQPHPINDVADAMVAKMEANSVDELTVKQKEEVEAQVEKYNKSSDDATAKVAALEEQVSRLKADKEFKKAKSATKKTSKTQEERVAYRKEQIAAARDALKKLRTGESGLSAVPLPFVRELIAIAPHVKNIMVDLMEQGVNELQDVIKHLHNEFKDVVDGITEKDIHNIIAGEYNAKRKPLTELQGAIRDLQYEAQLINKLEALENGPLPKTEKSLRERNQKIKTLKDQINEKVKQYEIDEPDYGKRLKAIKKRNENKVKELQDKIKRGDFEKEEKDVSIFDREDVKKQFPELRKEALDAIAKKEDAQHEFDLGLLKDEMARMTKKEKIADLSSKVLHTFKSLMAGIDDSATFVQNGLVMLANPKLGAKAWLEHWKDAFGTNWKEAFSDKRFKRELAALHNSADWDVISKSGVDIEEPQTPNAEKVSEMFEKNLLAKKFKVNEKEYQPWQYTGGVFERAFTSLGNNMRILLFRKRMIQLLKEGKTFETHPDEYKAAARVVNELTGRGKQNKYVELANPIVSPVIWAPKMLSSTINILGLSDLVAGVVGKKIGAKIGTEGYYRKLTPAQRKFALTQLGQGIGVGVAIMGAAALGGAKVDSDPYSVTFGDVIAGDHHYNVFGRFMPVVKTLIQVASGRRDSKGGTQDLANPKYGGKTRLSVVGGFIRGKVTPAIGTAMNLIEGKDYFTQKPFGWKDVPGSLIQPMSIKDLREGWDNDGTWSLLNRFLPAFEGIKTTDERDFEKSNSGGEEASGTSKKTNKGSKPTKPTKTNKK